MTFKELSSPKGNRLLALLPADAYDSLLPHLEPCQLTIGQVLHEAGKKQNFAYFPTTAIVALIYFTENGESNIVAMAGCDGMVGVPMVLGGESAPGQALVQTHGWAWRIRSEPMRREFLANTVMMQQWLLYAQALMSQLAQLVVCNRHHLLEQQFCRWLLSSLDRLPSNRIDITQEMAASMLGVRRQGVSEATARLEADGIIARARGQIEAIDRQQLESRVCECYRLVKREQERLFSRFLPDPISDTDRRARGVTSRRTPTHPELLEHVLNVCKVGWCIQRLPDPSAYTWFVRHLRELLGLEPGAVASGPINLDTWLHPQDAEARNKAVQNHLSGKSPAYEVEFRMRHAQGHWVWFQGRGKVTQRDQDGQPLQLVNTFMDISTHVEAELAFKSMASTDFLTGVASRMYFFESFEREFARSARHKTSLSLLALDLDDFKNVNDKYGHARGDLVLQSFVETVSAFLRSSDVFGRTGGEEFCILLPDTDLNGAVSLGKRIVNAVNQSPAMLGTFSLSYTVSVGIAKRDESYIDSEALMAAADQQLYRAKSLGRNRVEFEADL